uniref:Translational machinery protein n=1 Tax=Chryseobacterium endophyticum TaxID=1854762 RepID=A0AAU6WMX4_9FLAO
MLEKKLAGIWMDKEKAIVVKNHDAQNAFKFFLCSPVKAEIQHGNSSENAGNNAEQTNRIKYFKKIEHLLINSQEVLIIGPGTVQEEFKHYLEETPQFKNLKIHLDTAQQMSDEQVLEKVKEHFNA